MTSMDKSLWAAIFAGPVVWFLSFGANFSLVPWACSLHWKPALYVISLVAMLCTAASAWAAWRAWYRLGREMPGEGGGAIPRARIMAISGLLLSALSFLLILAQAMPEALLGACE